MFSSLIHADLAADRQRNMIATADAHRAARAARAARVARATRVARLARPRHRTQAREMAPANVCTLTHPVAAGSTPRR